MYLDDDLTRLQNHANERLALVLDWCRSNKLSLNPTKSEYMIISNRNLDFEPTILLGTDTITRKQSVKYLGLQIDSQLKFPDQVTHVKSKLSSLAGISLSQKLFNDCLPNLLHPTFVCSKSLKFLRLSTPINYFAQFICLKQFDLIHIPILKNL